MNWMHHMVNSSKTPSPVSKWRHQHLKEESNLAYFSSKFSRWETLDSGNFSLSSWSWVFSSVTIFGDYEKSWWHIFFKKWPKWWWLLGLKCKARFFSKNCRDSFLGNVWKNFGFLFQHLVTLVVMGENEDKGFREQRIKLKKVFSMKSYTEKIANYFSYLKLAACLDTT